MTFAAAQHHSFDVNLAILLGSVDLAILVHHFQYWINKNKQLNRNFKDGFTWTYQTRQEIAAHFPYWSSNKVRRYTDELVKMKILRKGNYNRMSLDRTIWYAFEDEKNFTIATISEQKSEDCRFGKSAKWIGKSAKCIGKFATPIPHSITSDPIPSYSLKDLGQEKTLAFHKNKEETLVFPIEEMDESLDPLSKELLALSLDSNCQDVISNKSDMSEMMMQSLLDKIIEEVKSEEEKPEFIASDLPTPRKGYVNSERKNKASNISPTKRYGLTSLQIESFDWLKAQNIKNEKGELVLDGTLCFWAKNYDFQRIVDVFNEASYYKPRCMKKYIDKLLTNKRIVSNPLIKSNAQLAKDFAEANGWHKLAVHKTYVSFPMGKTTSEINLNMNSMDFFRDLKEKHENYKMNT